MNWKKIILYVSGLLIVLTISALFWVDRQGTLMYGGLTEMVDPTQFRPQEGPFLIKNAQILAPDGQSFLSNQMVLIEQDKIAAIDSSMNIPDGANIIDAEGKYLIPGLTDAHVHLWQSPNDLLLYIANGITQIRELIGSEDHLAWKKEIEQGRVGPQMFVASPRLGTFESMEGYFMEISQGFRNVQNAEQGREIIQELFDKGYDGIKIYSHLNKESYIAVTEKAKSLGMSILGHIPFALNFEDIWANGQSDIAHFEEIMNALQREFGKYTGEEIRKMFGSFMNREEEFLAYVEHRSPAIALLLIEHDITVTSTLWLTQSFVRQKVELDKVLTEVALAYENPGISEGSSMATRALGWLPPINRYRFSENLTEEEKNGQEKYWRAYGNACQVLARNFAEQGVKIMAGTDANLPPAVPGFSLHDELRSLQEAGMSPSQVLASATSVPAQWLNKEAGKIVEGYAADLLLLDENPLEDIRNTKTIHMVITKGRLFDRKLLDQLLTSVKEANDKSRTVDISQYENL